VGQHARLRGDARATHVEVLGKKKKLTKRGKTQGEIKKTRGGKHRTLIQLCNDAKVTKN